METRETNLQDLTVVYVVRHTDAPGSAPSSRHDVTEPSLGGPRATAEGFPCSRKAPIFEGNINSREDRQRGDGLARAGKRRMSSTMMSSKRDNEKQRVTDKTGAAARGVAVGSCCRARETARAP
jgi:hypothetical protein